MGYEKLVGCNALFYIDAIHQVVGYAQVGLVHCKNKYFRPVVCSAELSSFNHVKHRRVTDNLSMYILDTQKDRGVRVNRSARGVYAI